MIPIPVETYNDLRDEIRTLIRMKERIDQGGLQWVSIDQWNQSFQQTCQSYANLFPTPSRHGMHFHLDMTDYFVYLQEIEGEWKKEIDDEGNN